MAALLATLAVATGCATEPGQPSVPSADPARSIAAPEPAPRPSVDHVRVRGGETTRDILAMMGEPDVKKDGDDSYADPKHPTNNQCWQWFFADWDSPVQSVEVCFTTKGHVDRKVVDGTSTLFDKWVVPPDYYIPPID